MNFVSILLKKRKPSNSIWVIVGRLTKSAHFIPFEIGIKMDKMTKLFIHKIAKLHGVLVSIVSNKDKRFISYF